MKTVLWELKSNLISGMKLIFLRKCRLQDFHASMDQLVLLLLLGLILNIAGDYLSNLPSPQFSNYGFPSYGFSVMCLFLAAYLISKILDQREAVMKMVVMIYSAIPVLILISASNRLMFRHQVDNMLIHGISLLHIFLIGVLFSRPVRLVAFPMKRFTMLGVIVFSLIWLTPVHYFGNDDFWYAEETEQEDPYAEYRDLNAEKIMFDQPRLLENTLSALKPGQEGRIDLFSINFAGYAYQDVFMKEVAYTQDLLDNRFGTLGHSVRLINHLSTYHNNPLATATNLAASLKHIGKIMNPNEDLLIIYLTSHGSINHELAVSFWPLNLNDINPDMLKTMLDEAGIQWRVIIISACYSGGFIEPLKNDYTFIATAAAPDRTSFGCSNENDFTYFGKALFKDQLSQEFSLIKAFQQAEASIEKRESEEQLTPSKPQLFVGDSMRKKLEFLSSKISRIKAETR